MQRIRTYLERPIIGPWKVSLVVSTAARDIVLKSDSHFTTMAFRGKVGGRVLGENEFDDNPFNRHYEMVRDYEKQGFRRLRSECDYGIPVVDTQQSIRGATVYTTSS